jgi:HK97 family phage major capsid protein
LLETTAKASAQGFIADKSKINGYNTVATSLMTKIAGTPDLYPLLFGDFSQMYIGQWGGISFIVDPYGGAGTNSLIVTVDMQADVQVANKKAFAKNAFFKLS